MNAFGLGKRKEGAGKFESEQTPFLIEGGKKEQCRQQVTKECNT